MLKPGGLFVSSTACIMDSAPFFRFIAPIGSALRLIPKVQFFTSDDLETRINQKGFRTVFSLENPDKSEASFLISSKEG